ncbi:MAG: hypothetical protein A2Y07_06465 [Planctomycetes bacterium GWF2_50_10]|nr:MAG: hypothetical protein A2Y07_06465 [Planctomycetes bacterium GWF2_50_10]
MLKSSISTLIKNLVEVRTEFSTAAKRPSAQARFTPMYKPASHRYLELAMLVDGNGGLQIGSVPVQLTKSKIWLILPHSLHCEGYFGDVPQYYLLWCVVVSRGVNFFISEPQGRRERSTNRLFVEYENAKLLWETACDPAFASDHFVKARFYSHFLNACLGAAEELEKEPQTWSMQQMKIVQQIKEYIEQHYRENISIAELSTFAGYTPTYLCTLFQQFTNETIHQYLLKTRLKLALEMINANQHQVKEIAFLVGFSDPLYFSKLFRKTFGHAPSLYPKLKESNK